MRKYILLTIAILLIPFAVYAWMGTIMVGGGTTTSGAPAPTYISEETFDSAGYDLSWTESAGTPNEDYTTSPAPLEGTQSLQLLGDTNSATQVVYHNFTETASATHWFYMLFNASVVPTGGGSYSEFIRIRGGGGGTTVGSVFLLQNASGFTLRVIAAGGTEAVTTDVLSVDTTYHMWISFLKGSGANAKMTVAFSANGIRPTSGNAYAESTDGTQTIDADNITIRGQYDSSNSSIDAIVDDVKIDDAAIGNSP